MRIRAGAQDGYLALQHHGHVEDGYTADLRAALLGVRVSGRTKPLGRWKIKKGDSGDLNGALFIQTAGKSKRPIGSFFFTGIPAVVEALPSTKKEPPNESTREGTNRPTDDEHKQADNPFIVGATGAKTGTPTTSSDKARIGNVGKDPAKTQKDTQPGNDELVVIGDGEVGVLPIRNKKWQKDDRFRMTAASTPKSTLSGKGKKYAMGQKGLLVAGTEENSQEPLFIPFDSTLVAVNYAGDASVGTIVYDLNASSEIDEDRGARLQSLMRVVVKPKALPRFKRSFVDNLTNVLALNLSPVTGQRDSLAGVFYDGATLMSTSSWGGPLGRGPSTCQHTYGVTGDKGQIRPLHLSTGALFYTTPNISIRAKGQGVGILKGRTTKSGSDQQSDLERQNNQENWQDSTAIADGDGPLLFEGKFQPCLRAPYSTYVHLEWDKSARHRVLDQDMKGVWRWRAESFLYEIPAPPTETPPGGPPDQPTPPTRRTPPGQPGQPERPGELPPDQPWGFLVPGSLKIDSEGNLTGDVIGAGDSFQPGGTGIKPGPLPGETDTGTIPDNIGPPPGGVPPGKVPEDSDFKDLLGSSGIQGGHWASTVAGFGPSELVYERPWNEPRRFSGTSNEVGFPAVLFRAQLFRRGAPWMTNLMSPSLAGLRWFDKYSPVVARLEGYGAQGGTPGDDILDGSPSGTLAGDPFAYTTTRQEGSPYFGGTSTGSICLLPPEVTLADVDVDFQPSTGSPVSTAYFTIPPVSRLALGRPDLTSGGITDGHILRANSAGALLIARIDANGATAEEWTWPTADGNPGDVLTTDGSGALSFAAAGGGIGGSGTSNRVAKFTAATTLGNSNITDDGTEVTVSTFFTVGTATDAAAQGDLVAGLTGAGRFVYDQSADIFGMYNAAGSIAVQISGAAGVASVFNEQGANISTRFEGDTDTTLLYVDAQTDRVGVGTNAPDAKFTVNGTLHVSGKATFDGLIDPTGMVFDDQASVPGGTPAAGKGTMWEHSTQKTPMWTNEKGLDEYISRLLFAQTASVAVRDTATETTLISSGIGTVTIPANYLVVGKTIRLRASGFFRTAGTGSQTLAIRFKYGSTTLLATRNSTAFAVAMTDLHWSIDCEFTVRSIGATGTVFAQAHPCFFYFSNTSNGIKAEILDSIATVTIDTTASTAIDLTADWNSAAVGDTITCTNLTLEALG